MLIADITKTPLNPRPGYEAMIVSGSPVAKGRILAMSEDKCTAHVAWHGTEGTYAFKPDGKTEDVGYIVFGRLIIRQAGVDDQHLGPGSLFTFPCEPFEMEIVEPFMKHSTLYNPEGLTVEVEPLPKKCDAK